MLREHLAGDIATALRQFPVVALLGPRQSGKTTLARQVVRSGILPCDEGLNYFDLEDPAHVERLTTPVLALQGLEGLVVIDEIQHRPELFPVLRVLVDRESCRARFLVLGSASRDLIRQGSESLAGRIELVDVPPFGLQETGVSQVDRLWLRDRQEPRRRRHDCQPVPRPPGRHVHGPEARAMVPNLGKRQVKRPRIYFRDTGILHRLLGIPGMAQLVTHPKLGASWEGFALEQVIRSSGASEEETYFWGVHGQAELDLLLFVRGARIGYEVKYTDAPKATASQRRAIALLGLDSLTIVVPGNGAYPLDDRIRVLGLHRLASPDAPG